MGTESETGMLIIKRVVKTDRVFQEDLEIFDRLKPHLDREGANWIMLGRQPAVRPLLLVSLPHGFMDTHLYIDRPRLFNAPAVYGFSGLYLGMAHNPSRVAARVTWLLRQGRSPID